MSKISSPKIFIKVGGGVNIHEKSTPVHVRVHKKLICFHGELITTAVLVVPWCPRRPNVHALDGL